MCFVPLILVIFNSFTRTKEKNIDMVESIDIGQRGGGMEAEFPVGNNTRSNHD